MISEYEQIFCVLWDPVQMTVLKVKENIQKLFL